MVVKKKKPRELTIKQRKFIDEVVKTGNATESANKVYKTKNRHTAQVIGGENLSKPVIKQAIEDRLKVAKDMIYTIATTSEKDDTKLRACQDIIDRVEGKPTQKIVSESKIELNLETASTEDLIKLIKK
jgi:phage terminase small subunit